MEDTAAGHWCDMQGHVAASAGRSVTLRSEEWAECVYVTYNLHHNRLDVGDASIMRAAQGDEAVCVNPCLISNSFKLSFISDAFISK